MLYFQTIIVRAIQAFIEAAPTLLFGIMAAAYLRMVVGPDGTRRLFAGDGARGLWRASLLASIAPVCSLGVMPIARELHRAGVSTAKVMSFTLAAPLLNPITLCYGWTAFDTPIFVLIVVISFLFSFVVGGLTARWLDDDEEERRPSEPPSRTIGVRRMLNLAISSSWLASGQVWVDIAWAMIVCGIAAALVPAGSVTHELAYTNPMAAPLMVLIATPAYISPTVGVMQVAAMTNIQFSLGAVVALHLLGVGLNGAVIRWIYKLHGMRRLISLGLVVLGLTLGLGYGADFALDHPKSGEDDTHALDTLGCIHADGWSTAMSQIVSRETALANYVAVGGIAIFVIAGLILRRCGVTHLVDGPDLQPNDEKFAVDKAVAWDRPLPKPVVAGFAGTVLLGFLVLTVYVYYPPHQELFEEMNSVRADALSAVRLNDVSVARRELARWYSAADKLPVSASLRLAAVSTDANEAARELCEALKGVDDSLNESKKIIDQSLNRLEVAYSRTRTAFGSGQGITK